MRILGVKVGEVTDGHAAGRPRARRLRRTTTSTRCRPTPRPSSSSPSVVSDRYVQLTPVYTARPDAADGAAHPARADTAVPVELDQIFSSLDDLDVALGPKGANKNGALSRLLAVGADNLDGKGAKHQPDGHRPLAGGQHPVRRPDDLFGTVATCRSSPTALASSDSQVRRVQHRPGQRRRPARGRARRARAGAEEPRGRARRGGVVRQGQPGEPHHRHRRASPTSPASLAKQKDALGGGPRRRRRSRCPTCSSPTTRRPARSTPATTPSSSDDPRPVPLLAADLARPAAAGLRPDRQGPEEQAAARARRAAAAARRRRPRPHPRRHPRGRADERRRRLAHAAGRAASAVAASPDRLPGRLRPAAARAARRPAATPTRSPSSSPTCSTWCRSRR